ncbi:MULTISPECIES: bifunctional proline dehydrogenase/L-glutamate gamma-semialdehyde dehydrogenase PutA [Pasteurellaceae]|uniref:Bifunctional protein PutA n=1 Tax=Pasteurella atlantica TaxID=2827233 RepID=A0AAW8CRE3_9PAST|nr:bifunctional proline dehydrogenase/L-glutamate gamma-semialdehyde dehydrogenase PutA [Pasteurella atlantica]MBR0574594.1 bifunctional proline dehydrogenase/L-glutamate gamma-semialdehyde dehydrogenase PutA [Pasteurella atlantica]MDP8040501.1 bifunctional proline dehydrogenase/L-glutamate gamma-semialdehyde dehydrogenase PutA [Pasteurella atlantica]MDP8042642.1 bifunctional proline dehydrogenase/L-glutamate gamma-semialdehyde dehydrogenase PutA [Pasteurella atlantica]MDP8044745.1 bifunctional
MSFSLSKKYSQLRRDITSYYRIDEKKAVDQLYETLTFTPEQENAIQKNAVNLINKVRNIKKNSYGIDALMQEFSLGDDEGIALMCLAEALLRIPDEETQDELIHDKLKEGNWQSHIGRSSSIFINAASYGLLLGKKLSGSFDEETLSNALTRSFARLSAPAMRLAMLQAMRILGAQFVTGTDINNALHRVQKRVEKGFCFSFDMLGEAAMTASDAEHYFQDYINAIEAVGRDSADKDIFQSNGVSVKLSAIHPRYFRSQYDRVMDELYPKLKQLMLLGKKYNIGINIDAEEASRLELSLDLVEKLLDEPELKGYKGIGFVIQAYSKRCPKVIDYLIELAREKQSYLMIRLVKGAYWDSEIKWAQTEGLEGFPVYTRKNHTDISYLACAKKLLTAQDVIYPQFATHNVQSLCTIYELGKDKNYEFQCLHGMGENLYDNVVGKENLDRLVRVYAPVGTHETLLAYLVRRLLENGANSSFVHQLVDETIPAEQLVTPPWKLYETSQGERNKAVKLPLELFSDRKNSQGFDLTNEFTLEQLEQGFEKAQIEAVTSLVNFANNTIHHQSHSVFNPADLSSKVGEVSFLKVDAVEQVFESATMTEWNNFDATSKADILRKTADLYEKNAALLMKIAILEAGKTLPNAIAELREAVDFLRYYAVQLEKLAQLGKLADPRGKILCISPWNFPLAIFTGQIAASLAAGNVVIAKPAEQTSLIAAAAVELFYQAGLPRSALQLVLGAGDIGAALVKQPFDGVVFTGSTEVAKLINEQLAQADNDPVFIAETGGQNVLVVDSSALAEQVIADVLNSAFDSAGQRCSALRILLLQEDVADKIYSMLCEAMKELKIGNPTQLATDVGPVIDKEALQNLDNHKMKMRQIAQRYVELKSPKEGHFVAPAVYILDNLAQLEREVFGPILHIVTYKKENLANVLAEVNAKGYALTGGCHSRIYKQMDFVEKHLNCGNFYINRNIVGAVVGVQPFGGHSQSGTGPKAGGEFYLQRLTKTTQYYSQFGDEMALANAKPLLESITGEDNSLAYLPCEVAIFDGSLEQAKPAAEKLLAAGFSVLVEHQHPLVKLNLDNVRVAKTLGHCQKGVYLENITKEQRLWVAQNSPAIFKCYDWRETQDLMPLYDEFSRSENTTAAGGNASLMAAQEQ